MEDNDPAGFVPALAYRRLTPIYDRVIAVTARENTFKRALLRQTDIRPSMRVLDLGCGTGTLAIWAKEQVPGVEIAGIDGDPQMLERARAKAADAGVDEIVFTEAMSFDLPYEEGRFDRVLSSLFFHHLTLADKRRTLAEARRVLKPDGRLHIADWGRPQDLAMKLLSYSIRLLDGREQTRDNHEGNLPVLIKEAGFISVRREARFRTAYGTMTLLSAAVAG